MFIPNATIDVNTSLKNGVIGQMWEVGDWGSQIVGGGRLGFKMCGRWAIGG